MRPLTARIAALSLVVTGFAAGLAPAGPLDPPAAPASTDGVRGAGTPISALPFAITQPGHYFVTRPLSGIDGITISASNVTVDLGGFTLVGPGISLLAMGVQAINGVRNVTVRNGAVRGWAYGVNFEGATQSLVEGVQASSNTIAGIEISVHSEVRRCNTSLNGNYGVIVQKGTVRDSTMTENNYGILVRNDSLIRGNYVHASAINGILVQGSGNTFADNAITDSVSSDISVNSGTTGQVLYDNRLCTFTFPAPDFFADLAKNIVRCK